MLRIKTIAPAMLGLGATMLWLALITALLSFMYLGAAVVVGSVFFGIVTFMIVLPLIPNGVEYLANAPNKLAHTVSPEERKRGEYPVYDFGFFTFLSPDQAKVIERGKRFIRIVMRLDNHTFYGETQEAKEREGGPVRPNEQEYWEVVETPKGELDYHPVPDRGFKSWISPFWWWKRYVYSITGAVFTGIPPFQKVRAYQMTRLEKVVLEEGNFKLVPKTDWSDHYRVADDQMFVEVEGADTRDKLPVDVQKAVTIRVENPYMVAYNTNSNWAVRAMTAIIDSITTFTRARTSDEVISIKEGEDDRAFSRAVVKQANTASQKTTGRPVLSGFGIRAIEAALLKNALDKKTQDQLQDEAIAAADARAREIRGRGEAAATGHLMDAVIARGERGAMVFQTEASVRKAKAVGESGGTIILGDGSREPVSRDVAFLHETLGKGADRK